ncbi:hypothetical protein [Chelatococcus sp. YT9]|uniref:hypothetical protein n=1 Tax=Chelatococcus sp. YT9 TaxID=2835635 RepID=UPI001BD02DAF|nr:hypothetical protein [Chelatococcus sp. YT9]MBS7698581.1 hypothetical protein [Chelatococcus sp. YT9]
MAKPLQVFLDELDAYAASHPAGAYAVYAQHGLVLRVWSGPGVPAAEFQPWVSEPMARLYALAKKYRASLYDAIEKRIAASWQAMLAERSKKS